MFESYGFWPRRLIMPPSTPIEKGTVVRGLGEIALRVNNLDVMKKFYEEVINLPLMTRVSNCAFFKIADGYGGHTALAVSLRNRSRGKSSGTCLPRRQRLTRLHRQVHIRPQPALSMNGPSYVARRWAPPESLCVRSCEGNANLVAFSQEDGYRPHSDL